MLPWAFWPDVILIAVLCIELAYSLIFTLSCIFLQQQDHYAVLGLAKLRFRATEDQIKRACE